MSVNNRKKVVTNFFWRLMERTGAQLVSFVVSIVLARILEPSAFGTIALVTVFITFLNVFIDSGFGNALIQKKDADDLDFSTVFYFNIVICVILYFVMFFAAPIIANFYDDSSLTPIVRVLSFTLIISGVKNVQQAYVSRTMKFKRFFFASLGGALGSAVIGIIMACCGFGVWALVAQQIINNLVNTIILWATVKWRPKLMFSFKRLKGLFNYGWKLLVSALLDTGYLNLWQLVIGKVYTSEDLAYYNQGRIFPYTIIVNINSSIDSVLLPTMSQVQDDVEAVKSMTRRAIKTSIYCLSPIMMLLAFAATPLVRLILTEKWLPCVPFMTIFCITFMFYPVHTANLNAIKALGRSDLFLILEVIKKAVGLSLLFLTMQISIMAMAYSLLISCVLCQIINSWPNKKLLNYGYLQQLKDLLPSVILAIAMGVCVYPIQLIGLPDIVTLLIQVTFAGSIYFFGSRLFRLETYEYILEVTKSYFKKYRRKK